MKLSREFWVVASILLGMLGMFYLADALVIRLPREQIDQLTWLPLASNLLLGSTLFYIVYRYTGNRLWPFLKKHLVVVIIWLIAWSVISALILLQNSARLPSKPWTHINTTLILIAVSGFTILTLAEKWPTGERNTWLVIAGLASLVSVPGVYWLNTI